eukprot:TRINITY_DN92175_c0_g1_i1.p1 TRINITY_DN92175_c0_g1~~TRINITY_DN92175_c0_g1_i1.p1  ORF type:complete len:358 (+),score=52.22 TRINITY_DN92175_c0_g1_i1:49-1122(+)
MRFCASTGACNLLVNLVVATLASSSPVATIRTEDSATSTEPEAQCNLLQQVLQSEPLTSASSYDSIRAESRHADKDASSKEAVETVKKLRAEEHGTQENLEFPNCMDGIIFSGGSPTIAIDWDLKSATQCLDACSSNTVVGLSYKVLQGSYHQDTFSCNAYTWYRHGGKAVCRLVHFSGAQLNSAEPGSLSGRHWTNLPTRSCHRDAYKYRFECARNMECKRSRGTACQDMACSISELKLFGASGQHIDNGVSAALSAGTSCSQEEDDDVTNAVDGIPTSRACWRIGSGRHDHNFKFLEITSGTRATAYQVIGSTHWQHTPADWTMSESTDGGSTWSHSTGDLKGDAQYESAVLKMR